MINRLRVCFYHSIYCLIHISSRNYSFHSNLLENLNFNTMMNFVNLHGSAFKIPLLNPEHYDQLVDRVEDYMNGINKDLCISIETGPYRADLVEVVGDAGELKI